jgi:hypothetical protein
LPPADNFAEEEVIMIGLLADMGSVHFPDLLSAKGSGPGPGLSGPVGLGSPNSGNDSVGLNGGIGLEFNPGSGSVGLHGGIGLFA